MLFYRFEVETWTSGEGGDVVLSKVLRDSGVSRDCDVCICAVAGDYFRQTANSRDLPCDASRFDQCAFAGPEE